MSLVEFDMNPHPAIYAGQLAIFGLSIKSFREPLKRSVQEVMGPSIKLNFEQGGRPAWEPLSDETLRIKSQQGFGGKGILERTGKLKRVASQLNVWTLSTDDAQISGLPGVDYWEAHQGGVPSHNIPARPFLTFQDADLDRIEGIFADWVTERAMSAGLFGSAF